MAQLSGDTMDRIDAQIAALRSSKPPSPSSPRVGSDEEGLEAQLPRGGRVVVVGASTPLGMSLLSSLTANDFKVRALLPEGASPQLPADVESAPFAPFAPSQLSKALEGAGDLSLLSTSPLLPITSPSPFPLPIISLPPVPLPHPSISVPSLAHPLSPHYLSVTPASPPPFRLPHPFLLPHPSLYLIPSSHYCLCILLPHPSLSLTLFSPLPFPFPSLSQTFLPHPFLSLTCLSHSSLVFLFTLCPPSSLTPVFPILPLPPISSPSPPLASPSPPHQALHRCRRRHLRGCWRQGRGGDRGDAQADESPPPHHPQVADGLHSRRRESRQAALQSAEHDGRS